MAVYARRAQVRVARLVQPIRRMPIWLRVILWIVVAVVPGGMLLLPVLARDAPRRRSHELPLLAKL
jgi:hypothetical protein